MSYATLDVDQWARENFEDCRLGDVRRCKRAVKVAMQMAHHPDGSTPDQCENRADLKALYLLVNQRDVTFTALARPHWLHTRRKARGVVLLLGDTTEIDFGIDREIEGLGPTGDGAGRGFMLHNSLMVDAQTEEIIGLAGQELFYRKPAPENETSYQRSQRKRESEVWGRVIDSIGRPSDEATYIHVFDRGADNLEVFCRLVERNCDWVIRAAQLHRMVESGERRLSVRDSLAKRPRLGSYTLHVRGRQGQRSREAKMQVRAVEVTLKRPARLTPYLKEIGFKGMTQWLVETREIDPPKGVEPLGWVLWTSLPVTSLADAQRVISYYERRWLVEEFHKAIKTGCQLERRQYTKAHRLEAVAGLISVLAVRLVQLKTVASHEPNRPAEQVVPKIWLETLRALRKRPIKTVRDFFRQLAGLGGFLLRKGDGEPGWITIWRGMDKLLLAIRGYLAMKRKCG